jgi:hypothetical protein
MAAQARVSLMITDPRQTHDHHGPVPVLRNDTPRLLLPALLVEQGGYPSLKAVAPVQIRSGLHK